MKSTQNRVSLVLLGKEDPSAPWKLGEVFKISRNPQSFQKEILSLLDQHEVEAWLFWDASIKLPDQSAVLELLGKPSDVFHAGLSLGTQGLPHVMNYVAPTWVLNHDPAPSQEATSWRMTFNACLIRDNVLRQKSRNILDYESLEMLALDWGYEFIMYGARIRSAPNLLVGSAFAKAFSVPFSDELLFVRNNFSHKWLCWVALRSVISGTKNMGTVLASYLKVCRRPVIEKVVFAAKEKKSSPANSPKEISVLIPTLNRYAYLRTLLSQIRTQTLQPLEIIVVDQTPESDRDPEIKEEFSDLPLQWVDLDEQGQCTARNHGLRMARGQYILFLDDDNEIPNHLIEDHSQGLDDHQCDVLSGVSLEVGAEDVPDHFKRLRQSDVFPTSNSMIKKALLQKSGLFDLAYDRGSRADGDLGMRLYLTGADMILDPRLQAKHYRATQGGLRTHGARVDTYQASRKYLFSYHLPSVTEIYLEMRYFTPLQVKESMLLRLVGVLMIKGNILSKLAKMIVGLFYLPFAATRLKKRMLIAKEMLSNYPQIEKLYESVR